jgi:hypothetical protein
MGKTFKDSKVGGAGKSKYALKQKRREEEADTEYPPIDIPRIHHDKPRPSSANRTREHAEQSSETDSKTITISTQTIQGDGKLIYVDAVENSRGRAMRVVEVSRGKRTFVLIPESLMAGFDTAYSLIASDVVKQ